ncbi:MAG TPA: hypothetical protein VK174_17600, partial [Chitinophagales bacterium]|nr:hypothetical protein [Chitinophagales bacterium]
MVIPFGNALKRTLAPVHVIPSLLVVPELSVTEIDGTGTGFTVIVLVAVPAAHGETAFVVKVRIIVPADVGVNVTAAGLATGAV